jgi:micrococcal nuclease
VVDGDTLMLGTGERVRLIGVDTPETKRPNTPVEYFGKEASAFTKRLAEGKRIRLEYDQANNYLSHKDQYGAL